MKNRNVAMKRDVHKAFRALIIALDPFFDLPPQLRSFERRLTRLERLAASAAHTVQPAHPASTHGDRHNGPKNFHGEIHIVRDEGDRIRADLVRMSREKVIEKWAKPNGKYTRAQVSAALAWASGALKGLLKKA